MRIRGLVVTAFAAAVVRQPPARADITQAVYDDAKSIIEEVVSDEVAQQVVPRVVCYARHSPPLPTDPADVKVTLPSGEVRLEALYFFPQSLQRIYSRQLGAVRSSLLDESAELAGIVVLDALTGHAVTTIAADPTAFNDADLTTCTDRVHDLFEKGKISRLTSSPLDVRCGVATNAEDRFRCEIAFAVRSTLQGKEAIGEDHLIKGAAILVSKRIGSNVANTSLVPLEERSVLLLRDLVHGKVSKDAVEAFKADIKVLLPTADATAVASAIDNVATELERLREQWSIATLNAGAALDASTFIDLISAADGSLAALCRVPPAAAPPAVPPAAGPPAAPPPGSLAAVCSVVTHLHTSLDQVSGLWPIVQAAAKKNYAEAAHRGLVYLFSRTEESSCSKEGDPNQNCDGDAFEHFIESFAQYAIESVQTGEPTTATSEAFRAAAVQAIRAMSVGGGFNRRSMSLGMILLPDLNLRFDWSSGFVNSGGRSYRYTASLSLLRLRALIRYSQTTYAAVHLSVLDPLAPLAELSIRDTNAATYNDEGELFWNAFAPRVELVYGRPTLSKHLAVSAGLTFHPVAAVPDATAAGMTTNSYTYKWLDTGMSAANITRYFEFGFALKYML